MFEHVTRFAPRRCLRIQFSFRRSGDPGAPSIETERRRHAGTGRRARAPRHPFPSSQLRLRRAPPDANAPCGLRAVLRVAFANFRASPSHTHETRPVPRRDPSSVDGGGAQAPSRSRCFLASWAAPAKADLTSFPKTSPRPHTWPASAHVAPPRLHTSARPPACCCVSVRPHTLVRSA